MLKLLLAIVGILLSILRHISNVRLETAAKNAQSWPKGVLLAIYRAYHAFFRKTSKVPPGISQKRNRYQKTPWIDRERIKNWMRR